MVGALRARENGAPAWSWMTSEAFFLELTEVPTGYWMLPVLMPDVISR